MSLAEKRRPEAIAFSIAASIARIVRGVGRVLDLRHAGVSVGCGLGE